MQVAQDAFVKSGISLKDEAALAALGQMVAYSFGQSADTNLKPGEEVVLSVKVRDLPRSITVKSIVADLMIKPAQSAPGNPVVQSSTVTEEGGQTRKFGVILTPPLSPSSVELRLQGGNTFWTFSNLQMMVGTHELSDFADDVNTHLDGIEGSDAVLTFLVKADGPGTASIGVKSLDYTVIQTQTWAGDGGGAPRQDRDLRLNFGEMVTVNLDSPSGQIGDRHRLAVVNLDVRGEVGPERLLPPVIVPDGKQFGTISAEYSIAQEVFISADTFQGGKSIDVTGVTSSFLLDEEAQIHIGLHRDISGMPAETSPLTQAASVMLSPDAIKPGAMTFAPFERSVSIDAATRYWLVFKAVQGVVQFGLNQAPHPYLGVFLVNRGGQSWKPTQGAASRYKTVTHLVYTPSPETQIPPIEILFSDMTAPLTANVGGTAEAVHVNVPPVGPGGSGTTLTIRSRAKGALNVSNVTQEYLPIDGTGTMTRLTYKTASTKMLRGVKMV